MRRSPGAISRSVCRLPRRRLGRSAGTSAAQQRRRATDSGRRPHADLDGAESALSESSPGVPVDPLDGPDVRARRPSRDDGRRKAGPRRRRRLCQQRLDHRGPEGSMRRAASFDGREGAGHEGDDLPGPDRPSRPPELQRAPALGRSEALHEPRPVGPGRHVPQADHRADEGTGRTRRKYVPAIVRYVECKCLVAGTTTTQGIALSSFAGIQHFYKGIVRNVEQTDEPDLPKPGTHIADVEAKDHEKFLKRLESFDCLLLHLSEGTDVAAREHFLALESAVGRMGGHELAGSGSTASRCRQADFEVLARAKAAMVWSPLSNLLLYGQTADVGTAREAGVLMALGPDWSPSGSKNLLGELKLARLVERFGRQRASPTSTCSRWRPETRRRSCAGTSSSARSRPASAPTSSSWRETAATRTPISSPARSTTSSSSSSTASRATARARSCDGFWARLRRRRRPARPGAGTPPLSRRRRAATRRRAGLTLAEATDLLADGMKQLARACRRTWSRSPSSIPTHRSSCSTTTSSTAPTSAPHLPEPERRTTAMLDGSERRRRSPDLLVPLTLDPLTVSDDAALRRERSQRRNLRRR